MTEKQGGSDVRANTTTATPLDGEGEYTLRGHKWFCSAPMCDVFLVLAQADEGVTCFLVPRILPDGTRNAFQLQRLKDKLGNRSNASSEVEFDGTWGQIVGEPGRGVPTIIEMVAHTRLDCVLGSTGGMRCRRRERGLARGAPLGVRQAARRPAADAQRPRRSVRSRARPRRSLALRLARAYDEDERAVKRLGTAVAKYHVCKRFPNLAFEAMECLGGNGYVEESGMPRIYREAPLNSIWEGSGTSTRSTCCARSRRSRLCSRRFFDEVDLAHGADTRFDAFVQNVREDFKRPRGDRALCAPHRRAPRAGAAGLAADPPRPRRRSPTRSARRASRATAGLHYGTLPAGIDVRGDHRSPHAGAN